MIKNKSIRVKTAKGRKTSSTKWLHRQLNDPYVQKAREEGYRSRSAYKLIEIDKKYSILHNKKVIIDVGSSPGGWSQVASAKCEKVIAIDLIAMQPIKKVEFIQCDFTTSYDEIKKLMPDKKVDVILSDMAPATCGHTKTDHLRILTLCYELLDFAHANLKIGGNVVIKTFHGNGTGQLYLDLKKYFQTAHYYRPPSIRKQSCEIYLVATKFLGC